MPKFLVKEPFQYRQILRQPGEVLEVEKKDAEFFSSKGFIRPHPPKVAAPAPAPEKSAEADQFDPFHDLPSADESGESEGKKSKKGKKGS